jgi:hypothetical protein
MPTTNRELFHAGHYNILAKRIRELRVQFPITAEAAATPIGWANSGANTCLDELVYNLADKFSEDNPRFERDTWMEATNTNAL